MWVESQPGRGSTFTFAVRTSVSSGPELDPTPHHPGTSFEPLKGLSCLIVEDHSTTRRVLEDYAVEWGMTPTACENSRLALAFFLKWDFDVAIVDAALDRNDPNCHDGIDLIVRVHEMNPRKSVKIVCLTPSKNLHATDIENLGITINLDKPAKKAKLYKSIVEALERKTPNIIRPAESPVPPEEPTLLLPDDTPRPPSIVDIPSEKPKPSKKNVLLSRLWPRGAGV